MDTTTGLDPRKMERIRRLIEMASRQTKTDDEERERAAAQVQAERLMAKYAVEEWQLAQMREAGSAKPVPEIRRGIYICSVSNHCSFAIAQMASGIGRHLNVHVTFSGLGIKPKAASTWAKDWNVTATVVGFPNDIHMWEMVFTVLQLQMSAQIDPKADPNETFDANVYRLHSAGVRWEEIARRMNDAGGDWEPVKWPDGGRLKRASRREASRLGEDYVVKANPRGYQRSFAEAFMLTVLRRFREASKSERTNGTEVALRDKFQAVTDFFEEKFKDVKPVNDPRKTRTDMNGWASGLKAGEQADLNVSPRVGNGSPRGELG